MCFVLQIMRLELGANLLGQERVQPGGQGPEEGSTSGVSTVNSVKSQKTADSIDNKYWKEYRDQMGALKMENMKLLQELIESQKSYQILLQQALEEQRVQVNTLTHLCENMNRRAVRQESGYEENYFITYCITSIDIIVHFEYDFRSYNSCISGNTSQQPGSLSTDTQHNTVLHIDSDLVNWLRNLLIDETSIDRVSISLIFEISNQIKIIFNIFSSFVKNIPWKIFCIMLHETIFAD